VEKFKPKKKSKSKNHRFNFKIFLYEDIVRAGISFIIIYKELMSGDEENAAKFYLLWNTTAVLHESDLNDAKINKQVKQKKKKKKKNRKKKKKRESNSGSTEDSRFGKFSLIFMYKRAIIIN
jgi:hypothetical protein